MKDLKNIALAILLGAIFTISAYADGKPNQGGHGNGGHGKSAHYGLSDSCWKVFLGQIPVSDAAKIAADQKTISDNRTQVDTLNQQIFTLLKNGTGKRDSTTRAKIEALEVQIQTLLKASGAAQMDIDSILKSNSTTFHTVAENCGRHGHDNDGGRDTTKGDGGHRDKDRKGHFGLSDSCWTIFLSQISTSDAAQLTADMKTITDDAAKIDTLLKQIRALKGGTKDSTVRAKIKALREQINALFKQSAAAQKDYLLIIRKNNDILQTIRKDCGRHEKHKDNPGDPTNGLSVSDIIPNPARVGSSASITITLTADAEVSIMIGSAIAQGPPAKQIFHGTLTVGSHTQILDLGGLGAGAYLVTIQSGNQMSTKKLIIQ